MNFFLVSFFLLYSTLHFYVFLKLKRAYPIGKITGICITIFMFIMVFAPVAIRLMEKAGHDNFARFMAYTGYTWMVVLFLFFSISICIDFLRLCVYLVGLISKSDVSRFTHADGYFFVISFVCASLITPYGFYEATQIGIEKITIKTPKIQKTMSTLRIVQVSDVHIGLIIGKKRMERIADKIRNIKPDILVATGDLIDGRFNKLNASIEPLKLVNPTYGKFAITGNHEYYAGIDASIDFMEQAGFEVLRGRGVDVGGIINIVGVDDAAGVNFTNNFIHEKTLLLSFPQDKFTILLKHRPVVDQGAVDFFDLQLSGHTHKGQIFPFRYIVKIFFPLYTGLHKISDKSYLYTSSGIGTWGPPMRFLAPPKITVIELVHDAVQGSTFKVQD
jgi:uncharacterized protein